MSFNSFKPGPGMAILPNGELTAASAVKGSSTLRTPADRAADCFNALDNGLVFDGATNNTPILVALLARASAVASGLAGGRVRILFPSGGVYGFRTAVAVPSNIELVGDGTPVFQAIGTTGSMLSFNNVSNSLVKGIKLDSQNSIHPNIASPVAINNSNNITFEDVELLNPNNGIIVTNSFAIKIAKVKVHNSLLHGVYFAGVYDSQVLDSSFQDTKGFGVILTDGCYRNLISGNRTTRNKLELVGVTQDSYENRIINNHAEGTGDNGISITGFKNVVTGNIAKGCAGNGIEVYGERNVVTGNVCLNNAQLGAENSGWRSGIAVHGSFGGVGQWNTITGNICDDEQDTPTQSYGIWINKPTYRPWAAGQSVKAGEYCHVDLKLYKAVAAGITGSTVISGTAPFNDGGVDWTFVRAFSAATLSPDYNQVSSNMVRRFGVARYADESGGSNNDFIGGLVPVKLPPTLIASQVSNAGGVSAVGLPVGNYAIKNGGKPAIVIAPPSDGGQQATAEILFYTLIGFGTVFAGGSGYAVNDILPLVGGTTTGGATLSIKVTGVDTAGAITTFTSGGGSFSYSTLPPVGTTKLSGGSGSGAELTGTVWQIGAITVTASGSGYAAIPAVTYSPAITPAVSTAQLTSSLTLNSGSGKIVMDASGTVIGQAGSPITTNGAVLDGTVVRKILSGSQSSIAPNVSLVRFTQTETVTTQNILLPTSAADTQPIQFVQYSGSIGALTFTPAVKGWNNGDPLPPYTGLRVRWDGFVKAWHREQ